MNQPNMKNGSSFDSGNASLHNTLAGIGAGVLAGGLLGLFLISVGAIEEAAQRFGSSSVFLGFSMHLFFSGLMGALFGLFLGRFIKTMRSAILGGIVVAATIWIVATAIVEPLRFGTELDFQSFSTNVHILVRHVVFGGIMGMRFGWLKKLSKKA